MLFAAFTVKFKHLIVKRMGCVKVSSILLLRHKLMFQIVNKSTQSFRLNAKGLVVWFVYTSVNMESHPANLFSTSKYERLQTVRSTSHYKHNPTVPPVQVISLMIYQGLENPPRETKMKRLDGRSRMGRKGTRLHTTLR